MKTADVVAATALAAHDAADRENQAIVRANRRRAKALSAAAALPLALVAGVVVGVTAGAPVGAAVAVVLFVLVAAVVSARSLGAALATVGGRAVHEDDVPALANLVEGLCGTFGVARPLLWLLDDPVPNTCSFARRGGSGVLVVTTGILDRMDLIQLEGVVAHELAHLKRHDAVVSAVAVACIGPVARLSGRDALLHRAVGRGREYGADQAAALAVRYPPGLHDALAVMEASPAPRPGSVFSGGRWATTRWVWIDPMVVERASAGPLSSSASLGDLDATAVRRDALAEW